MSILDKDFYTAGSTSSGNVNAYGKNFGKEYWVKFGNVPTFSAGTYKIRDIITALAKNAHTHTMEYHFYDCNCVCNCDCDCGGDDGT